MLVAKAYDQRGNEGRSQSRTIAVEHDHVLPDVALTAPADGVTAR